ncbi:kinase-like domain-containing protein, partial [Globomyces pollinis-pini]
MKVKLGDYTIGKTIGQGAFSKVKLATHNDTGQKVAIKVIDKKLMEESAKKSKKIHEEREKLLLLMRLNHPNIIKTFQVIETDEECYVVMEYAKGGELMDFITVNGKLSEKDARKIFRQIVAGMDYIHRSNVVHRDLKLENLLLSQDKDILISDFGLGRTFDGETGQYMKTFCGTPNYAAVELISGVPYNGIKSDIWAMGVVLYIMIVGEPPFAGKSISDLYKKIKSIDYVIPNTFSEELIDLFSKIFVKDPMKRVDMDSIISHPWIN